MPDLAALSSGDMVNGGGAGNAGTSGAPSNGGSVSGAGASNGGSSAAGTGGGGSNAGKGGSNSGGSSSGDGGSGAGAGEGGDGADAGEAGEGGAGGGAPTCEPTVMADNSFDEGLQAPRFVEASSDSDTASTLGATASSGWDANVGSACPGSLRFSFSFKGYASGQASDEIGFGGYRFDSTDWSTVAALHAMVKVSPADAPITGVRLFILSGSDYRYTSVFDETEFETGDWNEMVLTPVAGQYYEPTDVHRIGVEARLLRANAPDIPAQAPTVQIWVDDIWLEPLP